MAQREIKGGIPLAERSPTLKAIGRAANLKNLNRGDRAFILAKINSELGKPLRSGCAARIAIDYESGKENFYEGAKKARALGLAIKASEFARKAVEYHTQYEDFGIAVSIALDFSVKEYAKEAAASLAERLIHDGDPQSAEKLVRMFGIGDSLEAFAKTHVETLMGEGRHRTAAQFAKQFLSKEKAKEVILKLIESEDSAPSKSTLDLARESGASEEEILSAIEKSLEGVLAKGDSIAMYMYFLQKESQLPEENVRRMAKVFVHKLAEREHPVPALVIARENGIPREEVKAIAIQAIFSGMGKDEDEVAKISEDFGVGKDELAKMAEFAMIKRIREGDYQAAGIIASKYPVPDGSLQFIKGILKVL